MLITNQFIRVTNCGDAGTAKVNQALAWVRAQKWRRADGELHMEWDWDVEYLGEEAVFMFIDPRKASMFKLVWGGQ